MKPKAFEKYDFNKEYFEVPLGYFLKIDKKSEVTPESFYPIFLQPERPQTHLYE